MSAMPLTLNPPVKVGDRIQVVVPFNGKSILGTTQTVSAMDSHGTPYVRYRFGKVDKPVTSWVLPAQTP